MSTRESVTTYDAAKISELQDALWLLKRERISADGLSTYDRYVVLHDNAMMQPCVWPEDEDLSGFGLRARNCAHRGPAFLAWHREYLRRFENDLKRVSGNPDMVIPYWDWASDAANPDASRVWDIAGPAATSPNERVNAGSFKFDRANPGDPDNWVIVDRTGRADGGLVRSCGYPSNPAQPRLGLPTQPEIDFAVSFADYDSAPWNEASGLLAGTAIGFRNLLEGWVIESSTTPGTVAFGNGLHNRVHMWVGGSMGPGTSPNDPLFFLHHAFIDKLWYDWEQRHVGSVYQPQTGGPVGHNWTDPLFPWNGVNSPDFVTVEQASQMGTVSYV